MVELTSGNTGTGLAIVCAVKGYPFVAVMSRGNSKERARMMRALGAEVVLVDQLPGAVPGQVAGGDLAQVEITAQRIVRSAARSAPTSFGCGATSGRITWARGRSSSASPAARIDAFCDFAGTGGTFAGCAAAFKEHNPAIRCYVVEPAGAAVLSGAALTDPGHRIQGGGYARPTCRC